MEEIKGLPEYTIPDGVSSWVPGTDLEACLKMAVGQWKHQHPKDYKVYIQHIAMMKHSFAKKNGMTNSGDMRYELEVTSTLNKIISHMTHKEWHQDKQIKQTLIDLYPEMLPTCKNTGHVYMGGDS